MGRTVTWHFAQPPSRPSRLKGRIDFGGSFTAATELLLVRCRPHVFGLVFAMNAVAIFWSAVGFFGSIRPRVCLDRELVVLHVNPL